jgi:3-oxoacyl-[acyl-carrier protein] reductase
MVRTVVVTGGSSGIGRAVAARFAADGAQVFITGRTKETVLRTAEELDEDSPGNVVGVVCDSTDPAQLAALAARVDDGVDVLVNASGGLVPAQPGDDEDDGDEVAGRDPLEELRETWNAYVAQNVLGAVLTTAALRDLLGAGAGIVSIGSIGAERRGGAYGAAKAALAAWSAGLAHELGTQGVTVNVVSPGYIEGTGFFQGAMTDARHDLLVGETYTKRPGTPEDVAELVFFLASPGARHITGQTLHINGGAFTTR